MKLSTAFLCGSGLMGITFVSGFQSTSFFVSSGSSERTRKRHAAARSWRCSELSMVTTGPLRCRPIGTGSATPKTVITNKDLESVVETSDEWIFSRTGISQRRVLTHHMEDETIKDLATRAARNALAMSRLQPQDIDLVIVATSSAEDLFGDAPSVAANLGCTNAVAFDVTAACSGFLFATVTAGQFLQNGYRNAIVVGADALSRWVDWDDRNSCILFGDGAGAVVLTTDGVDEDGPGLLGSSVHSNGVGYKDLNLCYVGEPRFVATPNGGTTLSKGSYSRIGMNGKEVYKFATREVPRVLAEALVAANMDVSQIDWLLLHQANIRIMETVANRLDIPMEKVITNLAHYGNTSAGSIPLALDEAVRSGKIKKGNVIACAGFGAGLSWGAAIFKWGG